jgi:predicted nucleotidyltransferase
MNSSGEANDLLVGTICQVLSAESPKPVCAYLFGSRGRGDARLDSDVDIAILFAKKPPSTLSGAGFAIQGRLEQSLALAVDLIVLNRARPELVHSVLRDGQLLFDDDPSLRVAFEVKSRREYQDVLPYLREYRRLPERRLG